MDTNFYSLTVKKIVRETADAVSLYFDVPASLTEKFHFVQGQYLTFKFMLGGNEQRRAYSICTSPMEGELAVTVKKVPKGLVSTQLCDKTEVGHAIQVMPPSGRFFTPLSSDARKDYYLFGAGSGITPLMSILKTILEKEPMSKVNLLYSNRNEDSIIFKQELSNLQHKYEEQLIVEHILSQPKREKSGGLSGLFSKGKTTWTGKVGRIAKAQVEAFLNENPMRSKTAEYFVCGPSGMIDAVEAALVAQNIDKKHIHIEHFNNVSSDADPSVAAATVDGAAVKATLNGKTHSFTVPKGQKILDVMIKQKLDPPYSCTSGACSTCMAKVSKGTVKMDACFALDDDEVASGYVLTCQAHPTSPEVELTFDV
ncbi:MAG: ferredoxin--NADP reductase [Saprospiraceae bacterium]|nr:ferredoxin--NADP reductase [Saprospiraceae bacterium]